MHPHHEIVRRQNFLMAAEPVADNAFHIGARIGSFGDLLADHETEARMVQAVVARLRNLQQIAAASVS